MNILDAYDPIDAVFREYQVGDCGKKTSPLERRTVQYTGRVQGVGFRYTVRQIAENFSVTGYVQNLPDGRVRLVAEGESVELDQFLAQVTETMADYIHKAEPFKSAATSEFNNFFIQR